MQQAAPSAATCQAVTRGLSARWASFLFEGAPRPLELPSARWASFGSHVELRDQLVAERRLIDLAEPEAPHGLHEVGTLHGRGPATLHPDLRRLAGRVVADDDRGVFLDLVLVERGDERADLALITVSVEREG